VWNLLHVTLLALRILRWPLDFGKFVHPGNKVKYSTGMAVPVHITMAYREVEV
jgi:hypothetical protein